MKRSDLIRLTNAIISSGNVLLREAGRLFKPHEISAAQFNVLTLLADAPQGLRQSVIAQQLVVDPSSTTYVVDLMESREWVKRVADGEDRRAWRIKLTPAGRALHEKVEPLYAAALRAMSRGLDPKTIIPMTNSLDEIQRAAHDAVSEVFVSSPIRPRVVRKKAGL